MIYNNENNYNQDFLIVCGCAASVLAAYILPRILTGSWKKVLFVPTGAMLSKVSYNEGESIPGIAHGLVIQQILLPQ